MFASLLASVRAKPARALVRLWHYLQDYVNFETGLDRSRCEAEASLLRRQLEAEGPLPLVHPVAALRAIDRYLAEVVDLGQDPHVRRVELSTAEGAGTYWVVPRRPGWSSRLAASQPGHIEYWMRRHQVVPTDHRSIEVRIRRPAQHLWEALAGEQTPFATGGFLDGVLPVWNDSSPYRCRRLADPELRWRSVEGFLEEARERGAVVVVLPELSIDPEVRQRLRTWLREETEHPFELVVAGSFHELWPDAVADTARGIARVFDRHGDDVLAHTKLRPMRAMPEGTTVDEALDAGTCVELLHVPFGLLGLAICLDYCEIGGAAVADLWTAVGPALMLVPSMGADSTNDAHHERARPLALQHATATVVASQHPKDREALGLCWQPGPNTGEGPAVDRTEGRPALHGVIFWTAR